jgi:Uncharacterised nucleotidyltransferase
MTISRAGMEGRNVELTRWMTALMLDAPGIQDRIDDSLPTWSDQQIEAWVNLARAEKCFSQCATAVLARLGEAHREELHRHREVTAIGQSISRSLQDSTIILKGMALAANYPAAVIRDSLDVDLCVPDLDAAGELAGRLRAQGLECTLTALWARVPDHPGRLTGAVRFLPPGTSKEGLHPSVEMHLGAFSTSLSTGIEYAEWQSVTESADVLGLRCRRLDPTGQICLMLADYCVRRSTPVTIRHVVDMAHLLRVRGTSIDWDFVRDFVRRHRVQRGLRLVLDKAARCGADESLIDLSDRLGSIAQGTRWLAWYDAPLRVLLAPPQSRASWRSRVSALILFWLRWGLLKMAMRARLRTVLIRLERPWLTALMLRMGMRVAATPIARASGGRHGIRMTREGPVIAVPFGLFACTLHGYVDEQRRLAFYRSYRQADQIQ